MSDKEKDKRLLLPRDEFEEEASEGLGRLNREEASEDLRELRGRIERRVRKPRMIWLPAAAAVVILLVASTVYIALFRERGVPETEIALAEEPITDTASDCNGGTDSKDRTGPQFTRGDAGNNKVVSKIRSGRGPLRSRRCSGTSRCCPRNDRRG